MPSSLEVEVAKKQIIAKYLPAAEEYAKKLRDRQGQIMQDLEDKLHQERDTIAYKCRKARDWAIKRTEALRDATQFAQAQLEREMFHPDRAYQFFSSPYEAALSRVHGDGITGPEADLIANRAVILAQKAENEGLFAFAEVDFDAEVEALTNSKARMVCTPRGPVKVTPENIRKAIHDDPIYQDLLKHPPTAWKYTAPYVNIVSPNLPMPPGYNGSAVKGKKPLSLVTPTAVPNRVFIT